MNREIIRNRIYLSAITDGVIKDPAESADAEGKFARTMGETLVTFECTKVAVKLRPIAECTMELPVWYQDKPRFLQPITRILLDPLEKPFIYQNCTYTMSPAYRIDDNYWVRNRKDAEKGTDYAASKNQFNQFKN